VPPRLAHVDHAAFFAEPFAEPQAVTRACLGCHPNAARDLMRTSHWTWAGQTFHGPDGEDVRVGKTNLINNFCIGVQSNWPRCTSCHAGYGWRDDTFDFEAEENVDCLVCHETTGTYVKAPTEAGYPAEGVDLLAAAKSVGLPERKNCGACHFSGGGGDAVKHGDMDRSMYFPGTRIDVHMGKLDFACQTCHRTADHFIPGRAMSLEVEGPERIRCTDCHAERPHGQERLDAHTIAVSCQACHVPTMAIDQATKMFWDWSKAGMSPAEQAKEFPEELEAFLAERGGSATDPETLAAFAKHLKDRHLYMKGKGRFRWAKAVEPEYSWYNGRGRRYLPGQRIDPEGVTRLTWPLGDIRDPEAKIHPFKVHRGMQPFDLEHRHLLVPNVFGPDGYWKTFDWEQAIRLGSRASGLAFSGRYGWAQTEMFWPITHMVATKDQALRCVDCHGEHGRLDWDALGYDGDPAFRGNRLLSKIPPACDIPEGER
jgi:octaheme c-type cytochrome (tetrathionate reductase family)